MDETPHFAVVGHPNRGKSSIVATLSQNDSIAIALEPGTTRECHAYPLQVDGQTLYTLADTPGFQRPRKVMAWLEAHSLSASDRPDTVQAFLAQHRDDPRFHDECELLTPIVEGGAGIIYVVDGSVPYSPAHEAEMAILQWTGRPNLALINSIGTEDYTATWEKALRQFFQIVRRFNAVTAPFAQHLSLLRGIGQLEPRWEAALDRAALFLQQQREQRREDAASLIARALAEMLAMQENGHLRPGETENVAKARLKQRWLDHQRKREEKLRKSIEDLYQHRRIRREENALSWQQSDEQDLFSEHTQELWGVSRGYLATVGFGAGAVSGVGLDALTLGHTLGAGALLGGVIGAMGSYYYAGRLGQWSLGPVQGGLRSLRYGPATDVQLGYIIFGRALYHWYLICHRNHAGREPLKLDQDDPHWLEQLETADQRALQRLLQDLPKTGDHQKIKALSDVTSRAMSAFTSWQDERQSTSGNPNNAG